MRLNVKARQHPAVPGGWVCRSNALLHKAQTIAGSKVRPEKTGHQGHSTFGNDVAACKKDTCTYVHACRLNVDRRTCICLPACRPAYTHTHTYTYRFTCTCTYTYTSYTYTCTYICALVQGFARVTVQFPVHMCMCGGTRRNRQTSGSYLRGRSCAWRVLPSVERGPVFCVIALEHDI